MKFQAKKSVGLLLSFLMIISLFTAMPFTAGAVTSAISGDFGYDILDDGTAEITFYYGNATTLELPSTLDGYTVTSIGSSAFSYETLTSVTIPDSVTSIGDYAFYECASLKDVTIPNSVTSIGVSAFGKCTSLTSVKMGNSVTSIGDYTFYNCTNLTSITIPDSVTNIGDYAFYECISLTSVKIGNSVTSIGFVAFKDCASLTSVIIGNSVTSIGDWAFENCTSLKSVTIPSSVTKIDFEAFGYYNDENDKYYKVKNFTITGCSGTEAEKYAKENEFKFINIGTDVKLKKSSATVYVKGTAQIKATVKNGKGKTTYKTSNKKVAKVTSSGKVTGIKKGTATITVTNNGVSKKFKVTVKNPKLNKSKLTLKKGKSFKLSIKGKVGNTKFTSSDKKVATVSKKGNIKAKKKGKATITVKTNGMKLKCKITVR